jgi:hypothetical protein
MNRYDNILFALQFALVLSLILNAFLAAAVFCLAWLYPHANKEWLPKRLRTPPTWGGQPL